MKSRGSLFLLGPRLVKQNQAHRLFFLFFLSLLLSQLVADVSVFVSAHDVEVKTKTNLMMEESSSYIQQPLTVYLHRNGEADACDSVTLFIPGDERDNDDSQDSSNNKKTNDNPAHQLLQEITKDKYHVEHLLTRYFATLVSSSSSCASTDNVTAIPWGLYGYCDMGIDRTPILLDHHHLMPIEIQQQDQEQQHNMSLLPCRWHTQNGLRITKLSQLIELATPVQECSTFKNNQKSDSTNDYGSELDATLASCDQNQKENEKGQLELHLYGVPAGRLFVFAPTHVGQVFDLSHVLLPSSSSSSSAAPGTTSTCVNSNITMTVLHLQPNIFDIHNGFTSQEAHDLIRRALQETSPTHKLKRSTTGTVGHATYTKRTSENAFDTHGRVALALKQRILQVLGMDLEPHVVQNYPKYASAPENIWFGHDDGLQILRYNRTMAYNPHMDYLQDDTTGTTNFDFDSSRQGGNRFATVLLYMNDMADIDHDGGETVFTNVSSIAGSAATTYPKESLQDALQTLRQTGDADRAGIIRHSWEEEMVAECRRHFAVKPFAGRAVLFYSQHANGVQDWTSLHGGCPVLQGEKWAANLWVWNTPRRDHRGAPVKKDVSRNKSKYSRQQQQKTTSTPQSLSVIFRNSGKDPKVRIAELWYDEALYWGPLGHNDPPLRFNTYQGHRWNVRVDGEIVHEFVIGSEKQQEFIV